MKRRKLGANLDIDRRIGQSLGQRLEVDVAGLAVGRLSILVLEVRGSEIFGLDGDPVDGRGRETCYRVPIDARLDGAHLDVVHAYDVLVITVARQPGYNCRCSGNVRSFNGRRANRHVLTDDHRAGGVAGRSPRVRNRAHAYPVWLQPIVHARLQAIHLHEYTLGIKKYENHTNPSRVDTLDECAGSLGGLDCHLQHAVDVDVIGLELMWIVRGRPADQHALVQLTLERQVLGRRN